MHPRILSDDFQFTQSGHLAQVRHAFRTRYDMLFHNKRHPKETGAEERNHSGGIVQKLPGHIDVSAIMGYFACIKFRAGYVGLMTDKVYLAE